MDPDIVLALAGCVGGLVPDLIRIIKGPLDGFHKTPTFWVQLIAQVILGGVVAYFLAPSLKEAFTYGFSAPEVVTRLAAANTSAATSPQGDGQAGQPPVGGAGKASPAKGASAFDMRSWWSR